MATKHKYNYEIDTINLYHHILSYFIWHNRRYIYLRTQMREAESSRYRLIQVIPGLLLHVSCCQAELCVVRCKGVQEAIVTVWTGQLLKQILCPPLGKC